MSDLPTTLLLVDGALLRGSALADELDLARQGVALYADLGEEARAVGPWLLPYGGQPLGDWPLPLRLGASIVQSQGDVKTVHQHLSSLRTVTMDDGQRFYLRFADTRALGAMQRAWPAALLARIKGPIERWQWVDRRGQPAQFAAGLVGDARPLARVSLAHFDALVKEGADDRMATGLEALRLPGLAPCRDGRQFAWMEQALAWCRSENIAAWKLQREVARLAVLSGGTALMDKLLTAAVRHAHLTGETTPIEQWTLT